ncbi:MAG: hypothetical protein ACO1NO_13750 [Burkholderiaceae bacterium]
MKKTILVPLLLAFAAVSTAAYAKLPALSPDKQDAAIAAKEKAAWGDKVSAYRLYLAQDKTAQHYFKNKKPDGKPSASTPPCTDPGPYVAAQKETRTVGVADSKPVPAAGKQPTPPAK